MSLPTSTDNRTTLSTFGHECDSHEEAVAYAVEVFSYFCRALPVSARTMPEVYRQKVRKRRGRDGHEVWQVYSPGQSIPARRP